jgi:hypothetical protein
MAIPRTLKVKILRACLIGTQNGAIDANVGEVFEVSRVQAAGLVGDGLASLVEPGRTSYTVTVETPEHGDPVARKVSGPPVEKAGSKKE